MEPRSERMSEQDIFVEPTQPAPDLSVVLPEPTPPPEPTVEGQPAAESPAVDPVRSAAGRLGARRVHDLMQLGREYEREHGLKPGRQRLRQLIQLGRRYEVEHGLAKPKPRRRKKKADAWKDFVTALARVVKPAYRPAVEQMAASLSAPRLAA
jgi:hypothetical protein